MALVAEQVLAGPIVRRVELNRVAVWVALRAAVLKLDLTIYVKGHGSPGTVVGHATCVPTQLVSLDPADGLAPDRPEPA